VKAMSVGALIGALTILAGVSATGAKELKLTAAEIPAAVLESLKAHYPDAAFLGFSKEEEKGATLFEAQMKYKGRRVDTTLNAAGVMKEEETRVTVPELPVAVRTGLAHSDYAHGNVERAERHVVFGAKGSSNYELQVKLNEKQFEVLFGSDGRIISKGVTGEKD
jgi:hypothetical protein